MHGAHPIINPATEEPVGVTADTPPASVGVAVERACHGLRFWSGLTPGERQHLLLQWADRIEQNRGELRALEIKATGKRPGDMDAELDHTLDVLRYFAGAGRMLTATAAGEYTPGLTSLVRREPIGLVAAIAPWNYPLMVGMWKLAPALAAGCSVVFKPAPQTPWTIEYSVRLLGQLLDDCPPPVQVVNGGPDVGRTLVQHPVPAMVSFTGSTRAGLEVAASARLKRRHLELGGNAPVIVWADVDPGAVAARLWQILRFNAGQSCAAPARVIAHRAIAGELTEALVMQARALRPAAPDELGDFGPLISRAQLDRFLELVHQGVHDGGRLLTGGRRERRTGWFVQATVMQVESPENPAAAGELFGPAVTVETCDDLDQAIELANASEYGLSSSVWTRDTEVFAEVARRLDYGEVWCNTHQTQSPETPNAGFGSSGDGADLSMDALTAHTRVKHVQLPAGPGLA